MNFPTVFHVTHWKAGSQWVAEILKYADPDRFVPYEKHKNLQYAPLVSGGVYGTIYLARNELLASLRGKNYKTPNFSEQISSLANWWNFVILKRRYLSFVVIRDLRDTLISLYFSIKHSHIMIDQGDQQLRETLTTRDFESGILSIIENPQIDTGLIFAKCAQIQSTWLDQSDILYLRYEDIIGHEYEFFERLIDYCEIRVSREQLHSIVANNLFDVLTGRQRGNENVQAHLRKGIAGDWRNYFTEKIKSEFKQNYGQLIINTGYEKDLNW